MHGRDFFIMVTAWEKHIPKIERALSQGEICNACGGDFDSAVGYVRNCGCTPDFNMPKRQTVDMVPTCENHEFPYNMGEIWMNKRLYGKWRYVSGKKNGFSARVEGALFFDTSIEGLKRQLEKEYAPVPLSETV